MAGPPVREIYNAKARKSPLGTRKKGKHRQTQELPSTNVDGQSNIVNGPNAEILAHKSKAHREEEKKEKMMQELAAQADSKWSSKKKRRLEKYIDKKLKKDERFVLFQKLAKTQASIPSSILQSSSTLGTGKPSTHVELLEQAEDHYTRRRLLKDNGSRKRSLGEELTSGDEDGKSYNEVAIDDISDRENVRVDSLDTNLPQRQTSRTPESIQPVIEQAPLIGCALQRNPDGSIVVPRVRKKSKGKKLLGWGRVASHTAELESDTSFDSSDSGYDSPRNKGASSVDEETDEESEGEGSDEAMDDNPEPDNLLAKPESRPKRSLGFKDWAMKQLNAAKGYTAPTPDGTPPTLERLSPPKKKRKVDAGVKSDFRGPLGEGLIVPSTPFALQIIDKGKDAESRDVATKIEVKRPPEVQEARVLLPIVTEEQPIMEAIWLSPVVIICGETGSGKTTQVPQFLYEAGFGTPGTDNPGMIGVTQPRRVAAVSMANRVAHELSLTSSRVSYQIRYDATVSPSTSIKFMTDGVLLRELATDFLLTKYSVIIIDEAHERGINTDILIGVLSRVIKLREDLWKRKRDEIKPLRLIIMSATLRVSDFAENATLFNAPPPVINVSSRQYPVTVHFSKRTHPDYVTQAVKKAVKIHTRLPPGGILIFLTGQNEITGVCQKLEARFGAKAIKDRKQRYGVHAVDCMADTSSTEVPSVVAGRAPIEVEDIGIESARGDLAVDVDGEMYHEDLEALESDDDEALDNELGLEDDSEVPMHILPLYSLLPSERQMQVFQPPPTGSRLVVVSTNVAETSLTIPGIRYVVDCGRAKECQYDISNGIQTFRISWISKASASQRSGRAGRTGPGHCYRLYSSALYEHHFDKFAVPEIQRMPIEGVVLQMKSMHIDAVVNFPFPTPPDRTSLYKAERILKYLGALSPIDNPESSAQITDLGRAMSLFPLSPRFSRMLVTGQQHGCLPYVICIVSALSVGDPFIYEENLGKDDEDSAKGDDRLTDIKSDSVRAKETRRLLRKAYYESQNLHASLGRRTSDMFKLLSVTGAYEYAKGGQKFCSEHFVRPKAMEEIHKLRAQISNIVQTNFPNCDANFTPRLPPPNEKQLKALRQILTAGFIDQVAVRKDLVEKHSSGNQYATSRGVPYRALGIDEDVFIHPSSILADSSPPDYVTFTDILRTSHVFVKGLTIVNPAWLSSLGKSTLCSFSKPVKNSTGVLMSIPKFGPCGWELPAVKIANESMK